MLGFAYLLCLSPWKLSSRPETWDLRPSSVFPLVLITARPGSSVSANIYSISSVPLFKIIASYNRIGFCCSWWWTVGVGRRTRWATLYSVKSTLWSAVYAWRKKWDTSRKATQEKDTEGQMLSKQFELHWESIGDPDKHLNCVMWLCLSFRIGLAAICL